MPRATIKKILSNPRPIDHFKEILAVVEEGHVYCIRTKRVRDSKGRFVKNPRPFSERIEGWEEKVVLETQADGEKIAKAKRVPIVRHSHAEIKSLFHFERKALGERRYEKRHKKQRAVGYQQRQYKFDKSLENNFKIA